VAQFTFMVCLLKNDTHLAEDITQTVLADLARMARRLSRNVMLGGWLHCRRFVAPRST
jgi:hypothetical protein